MTNDMIYELQQSQTFLLDLGTEGSILIDLIDEDNDILYTVSEGINFTDLIKKLELRVDKLGSKPNRDTLEIIMKEINELPHSEEKLELQVRTRLLSEKASIALPVQEQIPEPKDVLSAINSAANAQQLDLALIELELEAYLNLGRENRLEVSNLFLAQQAWTIYSSVEDVLHVLLPLVKDMGEKMGNVNQVSSMTILQDTLEVVSEEYRALSETDKDTVALTLLPEQFRSIQKLKEEILKSIAEINIETCSTTITIDDNSESFIQN